MKLEALTPRDDLHGKEDSFKVYKHYLDDAFDNPKIRNLALSGSLGSGKSSIIRSYDRARNYGKKHFLYVSLMSFSNQVGGTATDDQKQLEYSLLNQIMSCCTAKDLPEGSIKGIPEKFKWLRICAVCLSALCLSIYMLIFHAQFGRLAEKLFKKLEGETFLGFELSNLFSDSARSWVYLGLYVLIGVILCVCVYCILCRCLPFVQLSKLTVKANNAEAEVLMGKERTSLDVYKFELAYALEKISKKYDYTVVFEDLERLDTSVAVDIMEKLHELNTLTNNHIQASKVNNIFKRIRWRFFAELKKKNAKYSHYFDDLASRDLVRFVYAISDRTLSVEHRTKFYDCIIPIVPASSYLNGKTQLSNMLETLFIGEPYRQKLCAALSDAVLDYRTQLTLKNEFLVLWFRYVMGLSSVPSKDTDNPPSDLESPCKEFTDNSENLNRATIFAIAAYKILLPKSFEDALSPNGIGILQRFKSVADPMLVRAYPKADRRKKVFTAINTLYNEGILNDNCLRMITDERELVSHWFNIILKTLTKYDMDPASEAVAERVITVIESFPPKYLNEEFCDSFRRKMADQLCKLVSERSTTQFMLVCKTLAAVSNPTIKGNWMWLIPSAPKPNAETDSIDAHKWYFTHTIRYLVSYQGQSSNDFISIESLLGQSLTDFCQASTTLMATNDMAKVFNWNHDMGKMLAKLLPCDAKKSQEHKLIAWDDQTQQYKSLGSYRKG